MLCPSQSTQQSVWERNDVWLKMMKSGAQSSNNSIVKIGRKALHQQRVPMGKGLLFAGGQLTDE